jgi:hypothetical protein
LKAASLKSHTDKQIEAALTELADHNTYKH